MLKVSKIKVGELAKMTGQQTSFVSKKLKDLNLNNNLVDKSTQGRIIGLYPDAAEKFLLQSKIFWYEKPAIILSANICGGVGKTTSILSLGAALRRICGSKTNIVFVDGDSQGSLTSTIYEEPALDDEAILLDYLDGNVSIDQILTPAGDNTWAIKSNLNQALLDKVLAKPKDIKEKMLSFYKDIFNTLGRNTKILQDHPPQLSNLFASSVCALHQLEQNILKTIIIPIRGDRYALQGASHVIREAKEIKDTFNFHEHLKVKCFFSFLDGRILATRDTLKIAKTREDIALNLSECAVRYCSKIPKSITDGCTIFAESKKSKATEDYQELLAEIFNPEVFYG